MNKKANPYRATFDEVTKLQEYYQGYQISFCLGVISNLNVAAALGDNLQCRRSAFDIAKEVGANPDALDRIMYTLSVNGFFKLVGSTEPGQREFQHNELSLTLVDPFVRDENPDQEVIFAKGMASVSLRQTPVLAKLIDFNQFDTICDVVINFDQPSMLDSLRGDSCIQELLENPKYTECPGNFFVSVPQADCYVFKCIFHNWDDYNCRLILETVAKSIPPHGKVYIMEYIVGEGLEGDQKYVSLLDIHMLQLCDAKERTKKQFEQLVEKTSFKINKITMCNQLHCQNVIELVLRN
ncbi:hypothetical protein PPL_01694 [Heterostelium album PN500]|uniref:O-methyltransferase domain-containing protein n=1 Tax=Heterostelium pallidum (strain ATCC 26659 / Pp 5 / PN500) TaxID=670386 RepID=D3B078_HETP5|nr:hypothetical protein PPL_01694 [Heterostelium album PN500]EFA84702.1 hypothetical protein PPL_01694 [Heterostelium album PN500]|eukprot:XP_020436815.1 hypothetical protein PPL_01694 [Heterostelium album PN500]